MPLFPKQKIKCNDNHLDFRRTQLDLTDRGRRSAESDLGDAVEQLSNASLHCQSLQAARRKLVIL